MPQSVNLEHITITPKTLAKQGIPGQIKEKQNYDKSIIHLPRQPSCSDLPQSVNLEHITITPKTLAKQGIPGQIKEKQNYDKSIIHLPRQHTKTMRKTA